MLTTLLGCSGNKTDDSQELSDTTMVIPMTDLATANELKSSTGITWVVRKTPMLDSSLVNVSVEVNGIAGETLPIDFGEIDPVIDVHLDDLDNDGFQEIYIITRSKGPRAYGTVLGMYSSRDTSVSVISYEGATPYQMKEGGAYEGYRGQDHFRFGPGELTNTFPVYKIDDDDNNPTGGNRTVAYELAKGQASILLRPRSAP